MRFRSSFLVIQLLFNVKKTSTKREVCRRPVLLREDGNVSNTFLREYATSKYTLVILKLMIGMRTEAACCANL